MSRNIRVPTQIRLDPYVKERVEILFDNLGLTMTSAINLFLVQCIISGGLPFDVALKTNDTTKRKVG